MTSKFDTIYESILNEMMPMSFDDYGAVKEVIDVIVSNIMSARGNSGHWSKAFTSKKLKGAPDEELADMVKGMVTDVVHELFPEKNEKGIEYTYGPNLTKENFKEKVANAIKNSFNTNPTYTGFLTDRFANKDLLGKAKEVIEVVAAAGIEAAGVPSARGGIKLTEVPKEAKTQKEINRNLRNYLASKGEQGNKSVWTKTSEPPMPRPRATVVEPEQEEVQGTKMYFKIKGFTSPDSKLEDAHKQLPEEDMTWEQVVKKVGTSRAIGLLDNKGIGETFKERKPGEEEEIKDLEIEDGDAPDISRYLRDVEKSYSGFSRKGFSSNLSD